MTTPVVTPFPITKPGPIESMGKAYYTPLMAPLPVVTRLPQPLPSEETVTEFLRIQSGGGAQRSNWFLWDITLILHSYAPNEDEVLAEENLGTALGWGAGAQGQTITLPSGKEYYVTYSHASGLVTRQGDPYVDLTRYRGMVMWRIQGEPLAIPGTRSRPRGSKPSAAYRTPRDSPGSPGRSEPAGEADPPNSAPGSTASTPGGASSPQGSTPAGSAPASAQPGSGWQGRVRHGTPAAD